jgi:hypothetical protein
MFKDKALIGAIVIYRQEVRPFTDKQVDLVKNFAGQAVIAIENTRLLKELRQRTDDLSDSLEQQTATSEVLNIISRSPAELEPVFQAILANAIRLCDAKFGTLSLYDGEAFRAAALYNVPPEYAEARLRQPWRPHPRSRVVEVVRTKRRYRLMTCTWRPCISKAIGMLGPSSTWVALVPCCWCQCSKTMHWLA